MIIMAHCECLERCGIRKFFYYQVRISFALGRLEILACKFQSCGSCRGSVAEVDINR